MKRKSILTELTDLRNAAIALCQAGNWRVDGKLSNAEQNRMWETLRDALQLPTSTATKAGA